MTARNHRYLLTTLLLVASGSAANSALPPILSDPEYVIAAWETGDGLANNTISAIAQRPEGYLWLGTFSGLVRFDGVKFTVLNPANTPALPSAAIVNLHLDRSHRLWVSTLEGLVVKDGEQWRAFGTKEGWAGDYVRTFAERTNGDLLITTFDGHVLAFENNRLAELPAPPGQRGEGYHGAVDESGQWWLTQARFVFRWNGQGWTQVNATAPAFDRPYEACAPARGGGVWVLQMGELLRFRAGSEAVRYPLPEVFGSVWMMVEDSNRDIWVGCNDVGLYRITPGGALRHWSATNGLGCLSARCVFEDRENNLWIGTDGAGLRRFAARRFSAVGAGSEPSGQTARSVWPARDGGMWIAAFGEGLLRQNELGIAFVPTAERGGRSAYGLSVLEDRAGRVWYGEIDGCYWRNPKQGFELAPFKWGARASLSALFEDSKGQIWIGSQEGVVVYNGQAFQRLGVESGLPQKGVVCFGEDASGHVWIAESAGLFRQQEERFLEVHDASGRALRGVLCFKAEPDGTMWMGTRASGLLRWRDGMIGQIGLDRGLPDLEVRGLIEDDHGHFWLPSNRGILRVSRKQLLAVAEGTASRLDYQLLDQNDGLPALECPVGQPNCARDAGGELWFATQKGLARIEPARFQLNSNPPPVQIEQLSFHIPSRTLAPGGSKAFASSGREIRFAAPFSQPLRLPPGSHGLEIEYAALSYSAPEKVRFQIKMETTSTDWEDVWSRRIVRFDQLTPGEHVFCVRAANSDGVWNETGASLAFMVQPYFWQTGWFKVAVVFGLLNVGGVLAWWRARLRHRRELEQLEQARRQQAELAHVSRLSLLGELSASMAHELNQPLTAILANSQAAQRFLAAGQAEPGEFREILKDIAQDTTRARDVIRHLRMLVKKGEREFTQLDLNETIQEVVAFLHGDIIGRNVTVRLDLTSTLPPVSGDRVQLQQVMLNLLLNAFDAMNGNPVGQRQATILTFLESPQVVQVTIRDQGLGIAPEKLCRLFDAFYTTKQDGLGMGLSVTRSIVEAHGGRVWAENNTRRGAAFHFTLPAATRT